MTMSLADLDALHLAPGTKAIPLDGSVRRLGELAGRSLSLFGGDIPFPAAVLKRAAIDNNLSVMQAYVGRAGAKLAPHAKTTMCPQLLIRQLEGGAWGLTAATMTQLKLCHDLGAPNLILANQLVGRAEIEALRDLTAAAPDRPVYVLVDSAEGAQAISEIFARPPAAPAARLLIELGMADGRCGVRSLDQGLALARLIRDLPGVALHGVEGYEGLVFSDHAKQDAVEINGYLGSLLGFHHRLRQEALLADPEGSILTAGGSAYYDLVARALAGEAPGATIVLRSGCYVTHDSGFYRELLSRMDDRAALGEPPRLRPALEVWARVISRPQPDLAIVMMGKRDVSFDIHLPMATRWFREGLHAAPQPIGGVVTAKLADQHGFLTLTPDTDLAVGDVVGFEISHPCTTFDKWSVLLEVDEAYAVLGGLKTFF
ncbi:D-serine dehydratase [Caulobacter rhizosphaerae]|uniref:D-serine dehydratase n=1 Tax=Caulobacter rhizosphaerae TaxID=2010972 RepID=A0ABU1MTP8_9CAUL|nr:amino acid deaminase [Caulobacter rhizosphaerae]MDR6529557.1 D-serine dehydratase [Caulobacter rhizosphaerae]